MDGDILGHRDIIPTSGNIFNRGVKRIFCSIVVSLQLSRSSAKMTTAAVNISATSPTDTLSAPALRGTSWLLTENPVTLTVRKALLMVWPDLKNQRQEFWVQ